MSASKTIAESYLWDFDPSKRQPELLKAWKHFIASGKIPAQVVPDYIAESWRRSREYNIDPHRISAESYLSPEAYRKRIDRSRRIVNLASPIIENLFESFGASRYVVSLYDSKGYHLIRLAQPEDLKLREQHGLVAGLCFDETSVGTTGFSLACLLRRPVRMIGCEHYLELLHHVSGVYAPIINPRTNDAVGVIAVGGTVLVEYPQAESIVVAASTAIENLLELDQAKTETVIYSRSLQMTIDSLEDGIVVLDHLGNIREMNLAARQALKLGRGAAEKKKITELPDGAPLGEVVAEALQFADREVYQSEIQLGDNSYLVKVKSIRKENDTAHGVLIQLKNIRDLSQMLHDITVEQPRYALDSIVGSSASISEIKNLARTAARTDAPVIIEGESGTGKEMIAQAVHNASVRKWKPFVAVNCAAIPVELIESIIFGHKKGAFTGAVRTHIGKFELAHEGTLFLDEIADMPKTMQAKMLRALEEGRIERVGGEKPITVNVRIVSASNKNLLEQVHQKLFRQDLFFRLNVFRVTIPPLRERKEDIADLAHLFVDEFMPVFEKRVSKLSSAYIQCLLDYDWPGNVRELRNAVQYSMARLNGRTLRPEHLEGFFPGVGEDHPLIKRNTAGSLILSEFEKKMIRDALKLYSGNKTEAAKALGIGRATLYRKLKTMQALNLNVPY